MNADTADSLDEAAPALQLDKRQRAMLREMGIRVWTPLPLATAAAPAAVMAPAAVKNAIDSIAANDRRTGATGLNDAKNEVSTGSAGSSPAVAPVPLATRRSPASAAPTPPVGNASAEAAGSSLSQAAWLVAQPHPLYTQAGSKDAKDSAVRWLVLAESNAAALQPGFEPLGADVGKLLDNMLRAARLHKAAVATLVPLVRQTAAHAADAASGPAVANWQTTLQALVESSRPDVVLVMGRLASQAVLQSSTAFGKLRGQVHQLHGVPTIVMQDAAFLLRNLPEKARAWDDLCLAMSLLQKP